MPVQVNLVSIGMFVVAGLSLIHAVAGLIALSTLWESAGADFPQTEPSVLGAFPAVMVAFCAVTVLPFAVLHGWLGLMIRAPRNWARIAAAVLLGVTVGIGPGVTFSGTPATALVGLLSLSVRVLALVMLVLLWLRPSNAYFAGGGRR